MARPKVCLFIQEGRERLLTAKLSTHLFYQGHYLPCGLAPQYEQKELFTLQDLLPCLAWIKAIIFNRSLNFLHDKST